jgi:glycosyltransferase involved in cell wall biosynthesis
LRKELQDLVVIIPAYKPDEALIDFSTDLLTRGFAEIIVVNDGSGEAFNNTFSEIEKLGCTLLMHEVNKGKGRALKTAFEYVLAQNPNVKGVVTADADGQHLIGDIIHVGETMLKRKKATMVLGSRVMNKKAPLRSRLGNGITRTVFRIVSGQKVYDTQTGLRAIPTDSLEEMLKLRGEHYEYEMNMLLDAKRMKLAIKEIDIETVYIDDNSGSHFNAWLDSWRIYRLIIWKTFRRMVMFGGSSLIAFGIDYGMFTLLTLIVPTISWLSLSGEGEHLVANVGARIVSATVNFLVNRHFVFGNKSAAKLPKHLIGYIALVALILTANSFILLGFTSLGVNVYFAKIITEALLFLVSFFVQHRIIFK